MKICLTLDKKTKIYIEYDAKAGLINISVEESE